jgi:hypothetical protein
MINPGNGLERDLGEIVSQCPELLPLLSQRRSISLCFIQKAKILVDISRKFKKLFPVLKT